MAGKDRLRPGGSDLSKWPPNRPFATQNPRTFLASDEDQRKCFGPVYTPVFPPIDQQTLADADRALREYAARRGWTHCHAGPGGRLRRDASDKLASKLLEAARRREIDVVLVWRLDRWGRSVTDLLATLQELEHLGVGFVSLTEALDLTTPAGRAMAGLLAVFAEFEREILRERTAGRPGPRTAERQTSGPAGRPQRSTPPRSGSYTAPASARPRSPAGLSIGRTSVRRILEAKP